MITVSHPHKRIFAAVLLAVGISLPVSHAAAADEARVDELFAELLQADEAKTMALVEMISAEWSKSGSPAIDLLLQRGLDAMAAGDPTRAVEHFTAAIDHDPGFAGAYNARAEAYYQTGDIGPALRDLGQAILLNPRHFGARLGFAFMLEEMGRPADALQNYREVQAILPNDAAVAEAVRRLSVLLEGQAL